MPEAPIERIINQEVKQTITLDEVTAGLGIFTHGILDKVAEKAEELGRPADSEIQQACDEFAERLTVMSRGLKTQADGTRYAEFIGRLKELYGLSTNAIDEHVDDKYRLISAVERTEIAIQSDMIIHKLLTEKAKRQLTEITERRLST